MESIPKLTFGMYCHASPTIPSIASKSSCPGTSRQKLITIHLALPELSRSACPDGLRLTLTKKHRWRTKAERRAIVEETLVPGASVSRVARRHDVNANQVFHWRKLYQEGKRKSQTVWTS